MEFVLGFIFGGLLMAGIALNIATRRLRADVESFMEWYNIQIERRY